MEWTCARCWLVILEDPHTDDDGNDVHPECCDFCHPPADRTLPTLAEELAAAGARMGRTLEATVLGHGGGPTSEQMARWS